MLFRSPLYPGDERRIFGEGLVAVFVALYNSLDDTGRQTLLRYARGEVLDAIGERLDVHRLEGSPAKTTMRFSVSTPQPNSRMLLSFTSAISSVPPIPGKKPGEILVSSVPLP